MEKIQQALTTFTIPQVCEMFQVSRRTVDVWINNGLMKTITFPSRVSDAPKHKIRRIPLAEIQRFIKEQTKGTAVELMLLILQSPDLCVEVTE